MQKNAWVGRNIGVGCARHVCIVIVFVYGECEREKRVGVHLDYNTTCTGLFLSAHTCRVLRSFSRTPLPWHSSYPTVVQQYSSTPTSKENRHIFVKKPFLLTKPIRNTRERAHSSSGLTLKGGVHGQVGGVRAPGHRDPGGDTQSRGLPERGGA